VLGSNCSGVRAAPGIAGKHGEYGLRRLSATFNGVPVSAWNGGQLTEETDGLQDYFSSLICNHRNVQRPLLHPVDI
jgi:hypothetical protein